MQTKSRDLKETKPFLDAPIKRKNGFGLPYLHTEMTEAGLAILKAPSRKQRRKILKKKAPEALQKWAIKKMGDDWPKYMDDALRYFFFCVLVSGALNDKSDPLEVLNQTAFIIPQQIRRKPLFPVDPYEVLSPYREILPRVKTIYAETRRSSAERKLRLMRAFQIRNATADRIIENNWKPSLVAYEIVARKYKLPKGAEALKKYTAFARDPEKLANRILDDFRRRS